MTCTHNSKHLILFFLILGEAELKYWVIFCRTFDIISWREEGVIDKSFCSFLLISVWNLDQVCNRLSWTIPNLRKPTSCSDTRRNSIYLNHSQADHIIRLWLLWLQHMAVETPSDSSGPVRRITCWHSADAEQMCDIRRPSWADHLQRYHTLTQMHSQQEVPSPKNDRLTRAISVRALQLPWAPDSPHEPSSSEKLEAILDPQNLSSHAITSGTDVPELLLISLQHCLQSWCLISHTDRQHLPGVFSFRGTHKLVKNTLLLF